MSNPKVYFKDSRSVTVEPGKPAVMPLPEVFEVRITGSANGPVSVDKQSTGMNAEDEPAIRVVRGSHTVSVGSRSQTVSVDSNKDVKFLAR
jgi:hypothetical protein